MTQEQVARLVRLVAKALDRAKKSDKEPNASIRESADIGELRAMITVAAYDYAVAHPCGCNEKKKGPKRYRQRKRAGRQAAQLARGSDGVWRLPQ